MTEISELLERMKAATGPDKALDEALRVYFGYPPKPWNYTASIDAALALVERVLPDWVVSDLSQNSRHAGDPWGCELALYFGSEPSKNRSAFSGWDFPTAPLAILTAALLALKDN